MCAKTHYASYQYQGIDPNDYEAVWFDSSNSERALISKAGDVYILEVQELNEKEERWASVEVVHSIQSIDEIKKLLFYNFDFSALKIPSLTNGATRTSRIVSLPQMSLHIAQKNRLTRFF